MAKITKPGELCPEYKIPLEEANQVLGTKKHIFRTIQETPPDDPKEDTLNNERITK